MIHIERQLELARERAKNYGELYGNKETADEHLKVTYAMLYEDLPSNMSSVAERDAWVKRQPDYRASVEKKKDAYTKWKTAETYMKLLFAEAEVWRTQQANNRYLDRSHE